MTLKPPFATQVTDGAGVAAALVLGADAAVLGTALAVAEESTYTAMQKQAVVDTSCGAAGTTISTFIDAVRGIDRHSSGLPGRCVANRSTDLEREWRATAPDDPTARDAIRAKHDRGVLDAGGEGKDWGATWAGAACGLVTDVKPAAAILDAVLEDARAALDAGAAMLR